VTQHLVVFLESRLLAALEDANLGRPPAPHEGEDIAMARQKFSSHAPPPHVLVLHRLLLHRCMAPRPYQLPLGCRRALLVAAPQHDSPVVLLLHHQPCAYKKTTVAAVLAATRISTAAASEKALGKDSRQVNLQPDSSQVDLQPAGKSLDSEVKGELMLVFKHPQAWHEE